MSFSVDNQVPLLPVENLYYGIMSSVVDQNRSESVEKGKKE